MSSSETMNKGATKAGNGNYIYDLAEQIRMDTGPGYSTAEGPVVEGERTQVGLMTMKSGTGARPHSHPNEQWVYLIQGKVRAMIDNQPDQEISSGTLLFFPAEVVHSIVALPGEDVIFFTCKDMTHGIIGKAADGTMAGPYYEPGFEPK
ncbi:cupin domain-containing protein [Pseudomonadota bacterium]